MTPACTLQRLAYRPLSSSKSSWVPRSTIRPSSTTRIWSASCTVERRWATTTAVRSAARSSRLSWMRSSVSRSRPEVRGRTRGHSEELRKNRIQRMEWFIDRSGPYIGGRRISGTQGRVPHRGGTSEEKRRTLTAYVSLEWCHPDAVVRSQSSARSGRRRPVRRTLRPARDSVLRDRTGESPPNRCRCSQ